MKLPPYFLFFSLFFSISLHVRHAIGAASPMVKMIIVDSRGGGDFIRIQDAVNSIPDNNNQWIQIYVRAGVYKEKVNIPVSKEFIVLQGDGQTSTMVEWGDFANYALEVVELSNSATLTSSANNTVVKGITFKNTFYDAKQTKRALAALVSGDKTSFHSCSFLGIQDTLCDLAGRHYYYDCYIEGGIDFIFGYGQSIFERCKMSTVIIPYGPGYLTAQGRMSESDTNGFVFKWCNVTGYQKVYLGRAWGPYSRVVFYESSMSDVVVPEGWYAWSNQGKESQLTYAESGCSGPGSVTSGRVGWEKKLERDGLQTLTDLSFIDNEGWLAKQP